MAWSRIMLKLAIMNEASRKNMISMSGMISMRTFLCGNGEPMRMGKTGLMGLRWPLHVFPPKFHGVEAFLLCGLDHDLDIGGGRFQFELKLGQFSAEVIEGNERNDRNRQAAHGGDERFANAARDRFGGPLEALTADLQESLKNAG